MRAALSACADATKYDVAASRAWWQKRGAELRARSKEKRTALRGPTMTVDLRGRELVAGAA
jgi:hypothetical protein